MTLNPQRSREEMLLEEINEKDETRKQGRTSHVKAINAVLEQFDSYKSNCVGCEKMMDCWDVTDICEEHDLICREKLLESARELDA